jgi:hypothetical protein
LRWDPTSGAVALHRDRVALLGAYARAVLDFGYEPERSVLLGRQPTGLRFEDRRAGLERVDAAFEGHDGSTHLQIKCLGERQRTRRLATAVDAGGLVSRLSQTATHELAAVLARRPRFVWLVGPNSIDPATHVFRLTAFDGDLRFSRIETVPVPAAA